MNRLCLVKTIKNLLSGKDGKSASARVNCSQFRRNSSLNLENLALFSDLVKPSAAQSSEAT